MSLTRKGNHSYGEGQADIRAELLRYSSDATTHFADAVCKCGSHQFRLFIDDNEGAAVRQCMTCRDRLPMGDSEGYLADASLEECECLCGSGAFEVTAGVALYQNSEDVRWFYLGCRCPKCGLTACYGDWKNEFLGYQKLFAKI